MSRYEVKFSQKLGRMVKVKKTVEIDGLEGTEEGAQVSEEKLKTYIPNDYFRLNNFSSKTLERELPLSRKDRDISVDVYVKFMDNYLNRLKHGRKPDRSYLVAAPDGFGKKTFVYQAIKEALSHGLIPSVLMTSHKLYALLDKKEYVEFYESFEGIDIAFITLGGAPTITDSIVIKTALDYCEREGVPLMVISRFDPGIFHKADPITSTYIGVRATRKGDFGRMQLEGFNWEQMKMIREELSGGASKQGENFHEMKKGKQEG